MPKRNLQIVATFKDKASKQLNGLQGKIKNNQATFRKMAAAGTAAFGGISAGAKIALDEAGKAEGAMNKFNTVFGENREEMNKWLGEVREGMPMAEHKIARMTAGVGDLLKPMGIAEEEAAALSRQSVELADKVAAFNDVNPKEVLEAMESGFSGMSRPLRRFGIDARETSLEAKALEEGLLEAGQGFSDLEPQVKQQVRAQALMAQMMDQSKDAIDGYEKNQDSYIRKKQEMTAQTKELKASIGNVLIPAISNLLEKINPVIDRVVSWIEKNPELTKKILIAAAAISGLVAVLGIVGMILPAIITGVSALGTVLGVILGPIGLAILAIASIGTALYLLITRWEEVKETTKVMMDLIKTIIKEKVMKVKKVWHDVWTGIKDFVMGLWDDIVGKVKRSIDWIKGKVETVKNLPGNAIDKTQGAIGGAWGSVKGAVGFATGGIVKKPTLGIVGEEQPEAVIPLNKAGALGGMTININRPVYGMDNKDVAEQLANLITQQIRGEYKF